jgi:hypothetical protein
MTSIHVSTIWKIHCRRRSNQFWESGTSAADLGERRDCATGIDAKLSMSWTVPHG